MRTGSTVLGLLALTAVAAGCASSSSSSGPLRGVNRDGSQAASAFNVKPGLPYEVPLRPVCTATGATVNIGSVTPWNPKGNIRLVDWGVRIEGPNHPGGPNIGGQQMTVKQVGGFNHGPVTVKCSETDTVQQLYISASTTSARSSMDGVTIHYNKNKTAHIQSGLALCLHDPNCAYEFKG